MVEKGVAAGWGEKWSERLRFMVVVVIVEGRALWVEDGVCELQSRKDDDARRAATRFWSQRVGLIPIFAHSQCITA